MGLDGKVPDATTVWLFRERLVKTRAIDKLFARFDAALTGRGYLAMGGQISDMFKSNMPEHMARANAAKSAVQARVEHVFAH